MTLHHDTKYSESADTDTSSGGVAPGKRARTDGMVQRKAAPAPAPAPAPAVAPSRPTEVGDDPFGVHLLGTVQRKGGDPGSTDGVHEAAARGIDSPTTGLPHAEAIQASFGAHDVSHIQAHVGGGAAAACHDMGASAYAAGNHVAFAGAPDLHTAAHEAAHVVQQAQGVNLSGGVGTAGDAYEQAADAVADRVVAGQSAADLLSGDGKWGGPAEGVQRKISVPTVVQAKGGDGSESAASSSPAPAAGVSPASPPPPGAVVPGGKVAKLHLYIDIDTMDFGIKDLQSGNVGHTWIALEYNDPAAVPATVHAAHKPLLETGGKYSDPMGFWPDTANGVYYSTNPLNSYVQGWMRHPDTAHQGMEKAVQTWDLTQAEVDAVIAYAESKRGAQYSVFFFNCTDFGKQAVSAAGKSPPAMGTAGICYPNAAYEGIKARQAAGVGNTAVTDLGTGNTTAVAGADAKGG